VNKGKVKINQSYVSDLLMAAAMNPS